MNWRTYAALIIGGFPWVFLIALGIRLWRKKGRRSLCWVALFLSACGGPTSGSAPRFILTNGTEAQALEAERFFDQVKACADAPDADPRGIEVTFMPSIPVPGGTTMNCPEGGLKGKPNVGGCMDDHLRRMYVLDWNEHPWFSESFGHEAIHLARWEQTSHKDADPHHAGPWWVGGKACQVVH